MTESWNKNGQNGAKSPGKNSGKMREKRMIFCKNYPQIWKYERKCEWVFFLNTVYIADMKNLTRDNKAARVKPVGLWNEKNCEIKDMELGEYYAKARRIKSIDEIKNLENVTQHAD